MTLHGGDRATTRTSPNEIAGNPLYAHREKIALLNQLKAEVTGAEANPDELEFEPEEIDAAIQRIELDMQRETQPQPTAFGGGL